MHIVGTQIFVKLILIEYKTIPYAFKIWYCPTKQGHVKIISLIKIKNCSNQTYRVNKPQQNPSKNIGTMVYLKKYIYCIKN